MFNYSTDKPNPGVENKKGIVLFIVLSMVLVVVVLANIILTFILSQSKLTTHQTSRIQASYAGQAGMNYTFEKLRRGEWTTGNYTLCKSGCDVTEKSLPNTIERVDIDIGDPVDGIRPINITTLYVKPTS